MSDVSVDLVVAEKYHIFGIQKDWHMIMNVSKLLLRVKLMVQIMPLKKQSNYNSTANGPSLVAYSSYDLQLKQIIKLIIFYLCYTKLRCQDAQKFLFVFYKTL